MIKIITLAFDAENQTFDAESLNEFISTHKIRFIRKEFFICQDVPYWSFVIDYEKSMKKKSHEEFTSHSVEEIKHDTLDEAVVQRLKAWRITEAKKQAYPAYIVLTNNQIEEISYKKPMSKDALTKIAGIGKNKISLYGDAIIRIIRGEEDEQSLSDIQPVVQYDEPDFDSDRKVSEVDEICAEQQTAESES